MKVSKNEIYKMIAELTEENVNEIEAMDEDENFMSCGMTSINCIQLIVMLEEKYSFCLNDEDLMIEKMNTVTKLIQMLERY